MKEITAGFICGSCQSIIALEDGELPLGDSFGSFHAYIVDGEIVTDSELKCPRCGHIVKVSMSLDVKVVSLYNSEIPKTESHPAPEVHERKPKGYIRKRIYDYVQNAYKGLKFTQRDIPGLEGLGANDLEIASVTLRNLCKMGEIKKIGMDGHMSKYEKVRA